MLQLCYMSTASEHNMAGWQVTLCDPIRQVTLRSSEMDFPLRAITPPLTLNPSTSVNHARSLKAS